MYSPVGFSQAVVKNEKAKAAEPAETSHVLMNPISTLTWAAIHFHKPDFGPASARVQLTRDSAMVSIINVLYAFPVATGNHSFD
jgi:hypothetical protein